LGGSRRACHGFFCLLNGLLKGVLLALIEGLEVTITGTDLTIKLKLIFNFFCCFFVYGGSKLFLGLNLGVNFYAHICV
jgi:hypothetical protein